MKTISCIGFKGGSAALAGLFVGMLVLSGSRGAYAEGTVLPVEDPSRGKGLVSVVKGAITSGTAEKKDAPLAPIKVETVTIVPGATTTPTLPLGGEMISTDLMRLANPAGISVGSVWTGLR
jgi:hypothetical protein